MGETITRQRPKSLIKGVCNKLLSVFPEFAIYENADQWALEAFLHLALRSSSNTHKEKVGRAHQKIEGKVVPCPAGPKVLTKGTRKRRGKKALDTAKTVGNVVGGANSVTHTSTAVKNDADVMLHNLSVMSMDDKDDDEMDTDLPSPGLAILPTELLHGTPNTTSNAPTQPAPATAHVSSPGLTTCSSPDTAALLPNPVTTTPSAMTATSTAPAVVTPPSHGHVTTTTPTSTMSTNSTAPLATVSQPPNSAPMASSVAATSTPLSTTNPATNTPAKKTAEAHMLNLQQKYLNMLPTSRD
ncbi:hypothetical protein FRC10_001149 [Ceratobasidium sp. 414]|nr:hypothetical protein FRC10_001149 [Ceratobasidium sp. 414]